MCLSGCICRTIARQAAARCSLSVAARLMDKYIFMNASRASQLTQQPEWKMSTSRQGLGAPYIQTSSLWQPANVHAQLHCETKQAVSAGQLLQACTTQVVLQIWLHTQSVGGHAQAHSCMPCEISCRYHFETLSAEPDLQHLGKPAQLLNIGIAGRMRI